MMDGPRRAPAGGRRATLSTAKTHNVHVSVEIQQGRDDERGLGVQGWDGHLQVGNKAGNTGMVHDGRPTASSK
jgi:hypothetical protein